MRLLHASVPTVTNASNVLHALAEADVRVHRSSVIANQSAFLEGPPLYAADDTTTAAADAFPEVKSGVHNLPALPATPAPLALPAPNAFGWVASGALRDALAGAKDDANLAPLLVEAGLSIDDARAAENAVRSGSVLVMVHVANDDAPRARDVLCLYEIGPRESRTTVADAPRSLRALPERGAELDAATCAAAEWPKTVWEKLRAGTGG